MRGEGKREETTLNSWTLKGIFEVAVKAEASVGASANGLYSELDGVDLVKESAAQEKLRQVGLTQRLQERAHADAGAAVRQHWQAEPPAVTRPDLGYGLLSSSSSAATSTRSSSRTGWCGGWSCSRASTSMRAASRRKLRRTGYERSGAQ